MKGINIKKKIGLAPLYELVLLDLYKRTGFHILTF